MTTIFQTKNTVFREFQRSQKSHTQNCRKPCIYEISSYTVAIVTDTGTEELTHMEIICAIVHQLTKNLNTKELEEQGFAPYYIDHTIGIWPQAASGEPWSATGIRSTGAPLADMHEDMAAKQKARLTYDNILRHVKDPDVCDPIRFLRERELVPYQRFGESLRLLQDDLNKKNFYAYNPDFDKQFYK